MNGRVANISHIIFISIAICLLIIPGRAAAQALTLEHLVSYALPDGAFGVTIDGNIAYIANDFAGIELLDITDPYNPSILGSYPVPGFTRNIYVRGQYAYVAAGDSGLQIVDVADPY